jgi:hypothetical protein
MTTFAIFTAGFNKLTHLSKQPDLRKILKTSLVIHVTIESVCILTAETVGIIFYNYSILLSTVPWLRGAFTVVVPEAYQKSKSANPRTFT